MGEFFRFAYQGDFMKITQFFLMIASISIVNFSAHAAKTYNCDNQYGDNKPTPVHVRLMVANNNAKKVAAVQIKSPLLKGTKTLSCIVGEESHGSFGVSCEEQTQNGIRLAFTIADGALGDLNGKGEIYGGVFQGQPNFSSYLACRK